MKPLILMTLLGVVTCASAEQVSSKPPVTASSGTSATANKALNPLEKDAQHYSQFRTHKSYALAYDVERNWASGYGYGFDTQQAADERALLECDAQKQESEVNGDCTIIARGDETPILPNLYGDYLGCEDPAYIAYIDKRMAFYETIAREQYQKALQSLEALPLSEMEELDRGSFLRANAILFARFGDENVAQAYIEELEMRRFSVPLMAVFKEDSIHNANIAKGWLALKQGNEASAVEYLLKAIDVSGSPVLGSFGPDMTLPRQLYQRGYHEAVLEYLKRSEAFWKIASANEYRKTWRVMIENQCPIQFQFYDTTNLPRLGLL